MDFDAHVGSVLGRALLLDYVPLLPHCPSYVQCRGRHDSLIYLHMSNAYPQFSFAGSEIYIIGRSTRGEHTTAAKRNPVREVASFTFQSRSAHGAVWFQGKWTRFSLRRRRHPERVAAGKSASWQPCAFPRREGIAHQGLREAMTIWLR